MSGKRPTAGVRQAPINMSGPGGEDAITDGSVVLANTAADHDNGAAANQVCRGAGTFAGRFGSG